MPMIKSLQKRYQKLHPEVQKSTPIAVTCSDSLEPLYINRTFLTDTAFEGIYKSDTNDSTIPSKRMAKILEYLSCSNNAINFDTLTFNELVELYSDAHCFQLLDYMEYIKEHISTKLCTPDNAETIMAYAYDDKTEGKIFTFMYDALLKECMKVFTNCFNYRQHKYTIYFEPKKEIVCLNQPLTTRDKRPCCHGSVHETLGEFYCLSKHVYGNDDRRGCCLHNPDNKKFINTKIAEITAHRTKAYPQFKNLPSELKNNILKKIALLYPHDRIKKYTHRM
jgi:hypothetical protein